MSAAEKTSRLFTNSPVVCHGHMNVAVSNRQRILKVDTAKVRKLFACFLRLALARKAEDWGEIVLVLSDDSRIRAVNRLHLGHDYATDVIAYTYPPAPGDPGNGCSGEVFANVERAAQVGPRHGGLAHELALYIAHGCDHLAGSSDGTAAQRNRMRRRELAWIRRTQNRLPDALAFLAPPRATTVRGRPPAGGSRR